MAEADAAARYAPDDFDAGDKPVRDTADTSRHCVRKIQLHPVLSAEWFNLLEQLKKLARIVQLEAKKPTNATVLDAAGRDTASEGTLWDQEAHETAIRVLVEEAKVNLCLRIMNDFKKWQDSPSQAEEIAEVAAVYRLTTTQIEAKTQGFEEFLGLLLTRALVHVETLQLMDIPLLLEHISYVLSNADRRSSNAKMQETMVLYMFASLMKHAESLNCSEVLARAAELKVLRFVTEELLKHEADFDLDVLGATCCGLAALADNEDFRTMSEEFFRGDDGRISLDEKRMFLELEPRIVEKVLQASPEKKKDIRPLLDLFKRVARQV